jgi:transposase
MACPDSSTPTPTPPPATWADHTTDAKEAFALEFPVHVGVDTGKEFHRLVARGPSGRRTPAFHVEVDRAGFDAADTFLTTTFPGIPRARMLVALELAGSYGMTFAAYLHGRGYRVVSMLAAVTKKHKETEDNSPRKDDNKDARQICKLVSHGFFVGLPVLDEFAAELRVLTTERHRLTREETGLKNRLQSSLDLVWPEFRRYFGGQKVKKVWLHKKTPVAVLKRWPTATDLAAAPPAMVWKLIKHVSRNHIPAERVRALIQAARSSVALQTASAARRAEVERQLARWGLLQEQMATIDARLETLVAQHPGAGALRTIPEVGLVCAATLLAELGTPESFLAPRQVLKLGGMNLAGRSSGISIKGRVKQTKRGRPMLRRELYLLAGRWCQRRGLYRPQYEAMRAAGMKKPSVLCAIARKLVPMLLHIVQTGEPFDKARWLAARAQPTAKAA